MAFYGSSSGLLVADDEDDDADRYSDWNALVCTQILYRRKSLSCMAYVNASSGSTRLVVI